MLRGSAQIQFLGLFLFIVVRFANRPCAIKDRGADLFPRDRGNRPPAGLSIADTGNPLFASEKSFTRLLLVFRRLHDQETGGNPSCHRE
jgi:hypothetical protein